MNNKPSKYRRRSRRRRKKRRPIRVSKIHVPRKDNMNNFYVIAFLTALAGVMAYGIGSKYFIISQSTYLKIVLITFLLTLLVPIKYYRKKFTISYYEFIVFNFMISTPVILLLVFSLNLMLPIKYYKESYKYTDTRYLSSCECQVVYLENEQHENDIAFRKLIDREYTTYRGDSIYTIEYSRGIFGIRMYESQYLH